MTRAGRPSVIPLPVNPDRRRLTLTMAARRRLTVPPPAGRAWINGREVGGPNTRYSHLGRSHD